MSTFVPILAQAHDPSISISFSNARHALLDLSCDTEKLSDRTPFHRVNEPVIIRLKWGQTEYHGRLISVDSYMNIQLSNTEEFIDGKSSGTLGQVLIR